MKLTIGGAMPKDYKDIFKLVLQHGVIRVFMDLSNYFLISDTEVGGWNAIPTYLYNSSLLDDTSYLLNKDLLVVQGGYQIFNNISGSVNDIDDIFCWEAEAVYDKKVIEKSVAESNENITACDNSYLKDANDNFAQNLEWLCSMASANPEIEFVFFLPPYSSAFWYEEELSGMIEFWREAYLNLADALLRHDNVSLYYFYDDDSVEIENWSLYRDTGHYNSSFNMYFCECFSNGKNKLKQDDYIDRINNSFERIESNNIEIQTSIRAY